jgi:hypothetical protein
MRTGLTIRALALLALLALGLPRSAAAFTPVRCFGETGYCVTGALLSYWERHGGLAVFGYPISDQRLETIEGRWTGPVQWFERDRLEDHDLQGVMAGRLGADLLDFQGRTWRANFPPVPSAAPGCRRFAPTGHTLCEPFLSYWQRHGGLERFGYPLTELLVETIGDWTGPVQYFERRRMEHHRELRGTPYEVLLGRLGTALIDNPANRPCHTPLADELRATYVAIAERTTMGCPGTLQRDLPATVQHFEHGALIGGDFGAALPEIYMIVINATGYDGQRFSSWSIQTDTWTPAEPPTSGLTPPPGRYEPQRGFGKVWRIWDRSGQYLGWAVEPEHAERVTIQEFSSGVMVWLQGENRVFVSAPGPHVELVPRR